MARHSKPYFKWHCVKALIGEQGGKRQCTIVLFISVNTSNAVGTKSKALKLSGIITWDPVQRWNRSGFSRPDPTGKFQNHRRLTGRLTGFWPARSTVFFTEGFCSLFNVSNKNFLKGEGMGEVLKFVTLDGVSEKKKRKKTFAFFAKMTHF